ncbi:phage major capsid protein [Jiella marina]|uniref:phage major capsid protein n=1 Tax=Jiella sp. LLJ827 TaxID=2917712 RepID=UPI002101073D|nr:phage major capsid protein [Jiella sp. LLJ827]MCQ0986028.1 phage major capsid protein [Jiella sp. LLJ827]
MELTPQAFSNAIELKSAEDGGDEDANAIVTKALGDLSQTVNDRLAAAERKSAERLDKLEARLNRPGAPFLSAANETDAEIEKKALDAYLRTGSTVEVKTLTIAGGNANSVVTPPTVSTTILEKIAEQSPVRSLATAMSVGGPLLQIPRLVNRVTPGMVTETGARPESEPSFEQIDIKTFEMAVTVPVSRILLEDANVDLNSYIAAHIGREFGRKEAAQFVVGNGTTEAEGVLTSMEVGTFNASAAVIKADELIDLFYSVNSAYAARGAWLMNRGTMAAVRKLKDTDGSYLWQPSIAAGQPATLLGRPVYEAVDMPSIAAGAVPIAFGDFATGYLIADRVGFELMRDDFTGADNGIVKIRARRRVGGKVVMGEALTKLKLKTA